MKKETITGLKRELKEEKEKNNKIYQENNKLKNDLRDYEETKEKLKEFQIQCAEYRGNLTGIAFLLDKFSLDMAITNKNKSEDEIYQELRDKKNGRPW